MIVSEALTEVLNRCGEGYENWTERAKEALRYAIISLTATMPTDAYPGLLLDDNYLIPSPQSSIQMDELIGSSREFIRLIDMKHRVSPATPLRVSMVSYGEYVATQHNSLMSTNTSIWYMRHDGTGVWIQFGEVLPANTEIAFAMVTWEKGLLDTGNVELTDYMSAPFLNTAIDMAAKRLYGELRA